MSRFACASLILVVAGCGTTETAVPPPPAEPAARATAEPRPAPRPTAPAAPSMQQRVRTATISGVAFGPDNGAYDEVFRLVRTVTGIPILMTPAAREVVDGEGLALALDVTAPISVANLLGHMTSRSPRLAWRVRDGVVFVEARAEAGADLRVAYYDVRDLVYARTEFIPPRIDGIPTGDDHSEHPRTGGQAEERFHAIDPDALVDTIRIATDPRYWEEEPNASIELLESGTLIVKAGEDMHRQVRRVLGMM